MPGAADGIANNKALGQWPAIVGARCADRQHVGAATYEQCRCFTDMATQHGPIAEPREGNALPEIRSVDRSCCFAHASLLAGGKAAVV